MKRNSWPTLAFCAIAGLGAWCLPAAASESSPSLTDRGPNVTEAPLPSTLESPSQIDPVMRALLIAMAARMLREAAASPDPVTALGDSLERSLAAALASPETVRMVEALTGQAFKDVPEELRLALAAFATSVLHHARREMLRRRSASP
ncbi:MAG: hypothetical protein EHM59_08120 [Betaproteobacteria bacterium]|nr:MAG: hypothetical protein EHM59_08120 [Betaproteobacteria bacterium]